MQRMPRISVICWCDAHNPVLEATLHGYASQRGDPAQFELIVADWDRGTDQSALIRRVAEANPGIGSNLRYLVTSFSGRADRNNFAAEQAKAPLLVFASADFIPNPGFIQAHLAFHEAHSGDECVGIGPVRSPDEQRAASDFLAWAEDTGNLFGVDFRAEAPRLPTSYFYCGNASIKARFFQRVGRFDPDFPYDAFDDFEFGLRATEHGLRAYLVPGAMAVHNHLVTFAERRWRLELAGRSAALLASKYPDRARQMPPLWRQRSWFYQALARYALAPSRRNRVRYWELGLKEAFARGYFAAAGRDERLGRA